MTTPTERKRVFDAWARLYDTAEGSPAERAAYQALSLVDVDRRGRTGTRQAAHPSRVTRTVRLLRFRARLHGLQLRAAVRHALRPDLIQPTNEGPDLSLSTLLTSAAALAALLFLAGVPYLIGVAK